MSTDIRVPGFNTPLSNSLPKQKWTADGQYGLCPTTSGEIVLCDNTGLVADHPMTQDEATAFIASVGGDPTKAPNLMQRWNTYTKPGTHQQQGQRASA